MKENSELLYKIEKLNVFPNKNGIKNLNGHRKYKI